MRILIFSLVLLLPQVDTRPYLTNVFPPEEFAVRRAQVMAQIGDGVAVLQGATERPAESPFRQNNQFFYLTGVEVPRAILVIDGKAKRSTLYLPDAARRSRAWGPILGPTDEAATMTGIEAVAKREELDAAIPVLASAGRVVYTPFRAEVLGSGSSGDAAGWGRANAADPWDGRLSREQAFIEKLKAKGPLWEARAAVGGAGCGKRGRAGPRRGLMLTREAANASYRHVPVTDAMLKDPPPGDWLMARRNYQAWSYSPLTEITRNNVKDLKPRGPGP